jgi:hypothetical protein
MKYPFWINDFNRVGKKYTNKYPLSTEVFKYPSSFWFGDNPKKPKKHMEGSIQRLIQRAKPQLPIFVIYNIPNRDVGSVEVSEILKLLLYTNPMHYHIPHY